MFKKIFLLVALLTLLPFTYGHAEYFAIKQASEFIAMPIHPPLDSTFGIPRAPDSIHIITFADNGSATTFNTRSTTAPFSDISIDTSIQYGQTKYWLVDQIQDLDGAGGHFSLSIQVSTFYDDVPTLSFGTVQIINDSLEQYLSTSADSSSSAAAFAKLIDDSTGVNWLRPTVGGRTADITVNGEIGIDLDNTSGTLDAPEIGNDAITEEKIADNSIAAEHIATAAIGAAEIAAGAITVSEMPTIAYFDTLIYDGPRGPGIYLDSAAGNTNTVLGTDGTAKNPVSTIATAKTLATALGYNRYYFLNASTFNAVGTDIPSSHQNWEFIGIGHNNELAFGTQRVDASRFDNLTLTGQMHASGGDVLYKDCIFGYVTGNWNGHAESCWLTDTIVVKADKAISFDACMSGVAGNMTPTIDFSGGASSMDMRHYSGGIRIMNGSSGDTISVETDGQVIISANNTSLTISLRGMLSPTDSGTTTNLTKDAVFSRQETTILIIDSLQAVLDSIQKYLDATISSRSTFDPTTDSTMTDVSVADAAGGLIETQTDDNWDELLTASEHNDPTSSGRRLRTITSMVIRNELAQGPYGANNRIQLDDGASAVDGMYDPAGITIIAGTGSGQTRIILEYDGTNKVAIVDRDWKTNPNATSEFIIFSNAGREHVNEGMAQAGTSNTITLNTLASSDNDVYNGQVVFLRSGAGQDQMKRAIAYNGTTKVLTVASNWAVNPDTSTGYVMYPFVVSSLTDDDMAAVSDSVLKKAINEFTAVPGSMGDVLLDSLNQRITAVSDSLRFLNDSLLELIGYSHLNWSIYKQASSGLIDTLFWGAGINHTDTVGYTVFYNNPADSVTRDSSKTIWGQP